MNTTDFIKKAEMVETHDGLKLYVVRNNASTDPFVPVTWRGSFPNEGILVGFRFYLCAVNIFNVKTYQTFGCKY